MVVVRVAFVSDRQEEVAVLEEDEAKRLLLVLQRRERERREGRKEMHTTQRTTVEHHKQKNSLSRWSTTNATDRWCGRRTPTPCLFLLYWSCASSAVSHPTNIIQLLSLFLSLICQEGLVLFFSFLSFFYLYFGKQTKHDSSLLKTYTQTHAHTQTLKRSDKTRHHIIKQQQ